MAKTKIFVAGHRGMVGSAIVRQLQTEPSNEIITASRSEVDLTNQAQVHDLFTQHQFGEVYLAAAKVGGIYANNMYPADFIYQNLMIQSNVIHAAHQTDVQKLLFLGSSCIYPRLAEQPMGESALLTGTLEPTNEPYAIAKIAGIKLCESYNRQHGKDYRSVMPTNLYGPGDNYHPENSHVVPALIRRFHDAKLNKSELVEVWGTGNPRREFLFVDDLADAAVFLMNLDEQIYRSVVHPMLSHLNVGTGTDCTIKELADLIAETVGYSGRIEWARTKPDGAPQKLLDVTKLAEFGWSPKTSLRSGLTTSYRDFINNYSTAQVDKISN